MKGPGRLALRFSSATAKQDLAAVLGLAWLLLLISCGTGVPWRQLEREFQAQQAEEQLIAERNRPGFLRPLWYVGPGVPAQSSDAGRVDSRRSGVVFDQLVGAQLSSVDEAKPVESSWDSGFSSPRGSRQCET